MITHEQIREYLRERSYPQHRDFRADMEEVFQIQNLPDKVKSTLHWLAWEDGHSSGYGDVYNSYFDLVDLVKVAMLEKTDSCLKCEVLKERDRLLEDGAHLKTLLTSIIKQIEEVL